MPYSPSLAEESHKDTRSPQHVAIKCRQCGNRHHNRRQRAWSERLLSRARERENESGARHILWPNS